MKATILIGAEAAYACITLPGLNLDVRLSPGKSATASLLESAREMRKKAQEQLVRADLIAEAAELLAGYRHPTLEGLNQDERRKDLTLELTDAWYATGNQPNLNDWLRDMAANQDGTLQLAAQELLTLKGLK